MQHPHNERGKKDMDKKKRIKLWIESLDNSVEYYISINSAKIGTMMKVISSYNFDKRRKELSLALPHVKRKSTTRDILINAQKRNLSRDPLLCLPVGEIDNCQEMAGNQQERDDLETQNCKINTTHNNSIIHDIKNNIKEKKEKIDSLKKDLRERKASMMKAKTTTTTTTATLATTNAETTATPGSRCRQHRENHEQRRQRQRKQQQI